MSGPSPRGGRAPAPLAGPARTAGAAVGRVVAFEAGVVRVQLAAGQEPVAARVLTTLDDRALAAAARERAEAVLMFEEGDPRRPVLLGLLRSATPLVDALLAGPLPAAEPVVARVDGRRVLVEGKEEVVLRCGKASLTLRRDGKVELRGVNLVTQADQVHKIRGGKVQIN